MSKFTRSWALKGNEHHAPETTAVALTGLLNVDGGGGGLPPSANRPTYGQQQNGAGGQQPAKPSTAPTEASHGVEHHIETGATENPSFNGGDGSYPPPHQKEEKRSAEKDNESGVKDHDGGGGGLPPSYGQQQNGAGGQQPSKPSTAPTASHGVDQIYRGGERLPNTTPQVGNPAPKSNIQQSPVVVPQPSKTTAVAPTGSLNVDGGGGGLPPSYGQQQNGAGGQQPSKPSTAPPMVNIQFFLPSQQVKEEKKGGCCSIL